MSAPRRWARRAMLSALAGGGLTAGLGGSLPGAASGAEAPAGATGTTEGNPPVTSTGPQAPAPAQGAGGANTTSTAQAPSGASTTPTPAGTSTAPSGTSTAPSGTSTAPTEAAVAPGAAPTVVVQRQQQVTPGTRSNASVTKGGSVGGGSGTGGQGGGEAQHSGAGAAQNGPATVPPGTPNGVAPAPQAAGGELNSTLLGGSAVSAQALAFYRIPLFLLPIYKAAAFQYDIPWQLLAAINEVETDYGTDLSVSTAGAVGWMQFMPSTWLGYGVDATDAGYADPYNPADAIFAAARYLHAAGAPRNLDAAILAYNHSQEYVESVLLRARLIASFPRSVIGTLSGLVDGRTPTPGARVAPGASGLGVALQGGGAAGSAPPATAPAAGSAPNGSPAAPGASSSATAGAVPAGAAPTPAAAASAGAPATPGSTPPPPPQVVARRAAAAANAPARESQLTDLLGAPGAPVVAVEDGRIMRLGHSHGLGRYLVLRDIYGDLFTYAGLGSIAHRYRPAVPSLERARPVASGSTASGSGQAGSGQAGSALSGSAQGDSTALGSVQGAGAGGEPRQDPTPTLPASAGHQSPVTLKVRARTRQTLAPTSAPIESDGETAPPGMGRVRLFAHPDNPIARAAATDQRSASAERSSAGNSRWLKLQAGSIVSAGTVLGHLDTPAGASAGRLRFAVRPAGDSATIDPQPLLANWRQLDVALHPEGSSGGSVAVLGATAGDALLMAKGELERAVLSDAGIQLDACGRRDVTAGAVDARVLAALVFISRSGLQPTVTGLRCPRVGSSPSGLSIAPGAEAAAARAAHAGGTAVDISAINGIPIAGHQGRGTIVDAAIRTLLTLRGRFAPHRIVSLMEYPEAPTTHALPSAWDHIRIDFLPPRPAAAARSSAHTAAAHGASTAAASPLALTGDLNEAQWSQLIGRIAALPKPVVAAKPSATAIRDPQAAPTNRDLGARGLAAGA